MFNTEGEDISGMVCDTAAMGPFDPVWLLALMKAESGLNPKAERWGLETARAKTLLANLENLGYRQDLQALAIRAFPDVSFGYVQFTVAYGYYGDHTNGIDNILDVRLHSFQSPVQDLQEAAKKLAVYLPESLDKTPLGAFIIWNAGSDRRNDVDWVKRWAGNMAAYQMALEWAEEYRA